MKPTTCLKASYWHVWCELDNNTHSVAQTRNATCALKNGVPQTNDDGAIRLYSRLIVRARSMAVRRNVAMPWRTLQARHNTLGETIVGLRNIVIPIHTSHVYSNGKPVFLLRDDT